METPLKSDQRVIRSRSGTKSRRVRGSPTSMRSKVTRNIMLSMETTQVSSPANVPYSDE